jgi:hypothetical protein
MSLSFTKQVTARFIYNKMNPRLTDSTIKAIMRHDSERYDSLIITQF